MTTLAGGIGQDGQPGQVGVAARVGAKDDRRPTQQGEGGCRATWG